jgi:hypothetical protein
MMKNSDAFRENAENCLNLAEAATSEPAALRYRRMARAWTSLAAEQDWLDGHPTQTQRATELAESAINELSDEGASNADVRDRKHLLIDGPSEFRAARVDND